MKSKVRYSFNAQGNFIIDDYNHASVFASFLPAIAGKEGIPLWAFYVNRAQGIATFGLQDKDHSILEFLPANKAFSAVFEKGFRTFIKLDRKVYYEPFCITDNTNLVVQQRMIINSGYLQIEEFNKSLGLKFNVSYFTLPQEPLGTLVRILEIENLSSELKTLELLDGLPEIAPFGLEDVYYKNLSRTIEAWIHTQLEDKYCLFRLLTSLRDTSQINYIKGANFYMSYYFYSGRQHFMKYIVDPKYIFLKDSSRQYPYNFFKTSFSYPQSQIISGIMPAAMSYGSFRIGGRKKISIFSLVGAFEFSYLLDRLIYKTQDPNFVSHKFKLNCQLIEDIKNTAFVYCGNKQFSKYVSSSYLDNVLRGGWPASFRFGTKERVFYIFSRKHGDLERDYNRFRVLASFYSYGEGNFRDINQNRRCDLFFNPALGRANIHLFFNLQRLDGYNPLVVKGYSLYFSHFPRKALRKFVAARYIVSLREILSKEFSLPQLINFIYRNKIRVKDWEGLIGFIVNEAEHIPAAEFGEGFWVDHWFYNLDLIENYLSFFPDEQNELLEEKAYTFYDDEIGVNPRSCRYKKDNKGVIYQDNFLFVSEEKKKAIEQRVFNKNAVRDKKGEGEVVYVNLWTKLVVLLLNKAASLDAAGRGIEMEAGKPGWCDALNGLPRIFGSSLSETLELKRLTLMMAKFIEGAGLKRSIELPQEIQEFFVGMKRLLARSYKNNFSDNYYFWDSANLLKEKYRKKVFWGLSGKKRKVTLQDLRTFCSLLHKKIDRSLKSLEKKYPLLPTYFVSERTHSQNNLQGIKFTSRPLPLFLESIVHYLKVCSLSQARSIYQKVKRSPLFDEKLKMYRLNASLHKEPLSIGRIRVFNSGWLENESIWLHMEYKYLLELLKAGLYWEFYHEFYQAGVCFQKAEVYGRNPLENSSFIVSSAYMDKSIWGKGFVARLSGSTAELLNIFILMALGRQPFFIKEKEVHLNFSPILEKSLFTHRRQTIEVYLGEDKRIFTIGANAFCFKMFNSTLVCYYNPSRKNTFEKDAIIKKIDIYYKDNTKSTFTANIIGEPDSLRIRNREAELINVFIE